MSGLGRWERRPIEEVRRAWSRLADRIGAEYRPGAAETPTVRHVVGEWILVLRRMRTDQGVMTVLQTHFYNEEGFSFTLRSERLFDHLFTSLGFMQDVEIGQAAFDRRFVVKASSVARVRELLDERLVDLVLAQPKLDLRVAGSFTVYAHYPAFGSSTPEDVDLLLFHERGDVVDEDRLAGLFEIFRVVLDRLCPGSRGYEEDVEKLIARLRRPGGEIRSVQDSLLLWDGDAVRIDAAERLGALGDPEVVPALIQVLDEEEPGPVVASVRALAAVGDPRAVGPLVLLLGDRKREVGAVPVGESAGEALRALGAGGVVDVFEAALAGEPAGLREHGAEHRDEIVGALMAVVDSAAFVEREHAARALGELGATEALPLLRSKSWALGMKTRLTEAASEAVEAIESRASLPRPAATAPPEADTHPRPAGAPDVADDETLPRAADGGDPDRSP